MKKGILLILVFLCTHWASNAQNWAPISTTDKFDYKLDTASAISNTLWVDSAQAVNGDSVYYMNLIVKNFYNQGYPAYAKKNQPQFLQKQIIADTGGLYHLQNPNNIALYTWASVGDSMLFDSTHNIAAKVIAADTATVLGSNDSVKTYLLSSGDTVILSKNYGLVQYPEGYGTHQYYWLAGIEGGRAIGEHAFRFKDIFNFQPGDTLWYYDEECDATMYNNGPPCFSDTGRRSIDDSLFYYSDTLYYLHYYNNYDSLTHYLYVVNNPDNDVNLYPNNVIKVKPYYFDFPADSSFDYIDFTYGLSRGGIAGIANCYPPNYDTSGYNFYIGCVNYRDRAGRLIKSCNNYYSQDTTMGDSLIISNNAGFTVGPNARYFMEGLGITYFSSFGFEQGGETFLFAFRHANDSVWTVLDSALLNNLRPIGINQPSIQAANNIKTLNNPVGNKLFVQLAKDGAYTLQLFDLSGQKLVEQTSAGQQTEVDMSPYAEGLYILSVQTDKGVERRKLVKQ